MIRCKFCEHESNCPDYRPDEVYEDDYICTSFGMDIVNGVQNCWRSVAAFAIRFGICLLLASTTTQGLHAVAVLCAAGVSLLWEVHARLWRG